MALFPRMHGVRAMLGNTKSASQVIECDAVVKIARSRSNSEFRLLLSCASEVLDRCRRASLQVEETLNKIADPKLRVKEPMWEMRGSYLPVNRMEALLWMERMQKNAGGKLKFTPKTIVPCEGTNLVRAACPSRWPYVARCCKLRGAMRCQSCQ